MRSRIISWLTAVIVTKRDTYFLQKKAG
jgi:hypothetical protein